MDSYTDYSSKRLPIEKLCMRLVFLILFCQVCLLASSQVPDSIQKAKSKRLSLSKFPKPEAAQKKNAYVVVTSDKKSSTSGDTWENAWTDYIEDQSRVIAGKLLAKDSSRRIYKVFIDFWVNEDGSLKEFTIAGSDQVFVPAQAIIDGNKVVVWSDAVAQPAAVRFAWKNFPTPNLFNKAGLPASPFRTDNWKLITEGKN